MYVFADQTLQKVVEGSRAQQPNTGWTLQNKQKKKDKERKREKTLES